MKEARQVLNEHARPPLLILSNSALTGAPLVYLEYVALIMALGVQRQRPMPRSVRHVQRGG